MDSKFVDSWLVSECPFPSCPNLTILREREETRQFALGSVRRALYDHLVGLEIIEQIGGYQKALAVIRQRIPSSISVQSGDLGEVLATEYVIQRTSYFVPVKRLRHKDDRNMAMRGDDVLGFRKEGRRLQVLKVEAKSRQQLAVTTVRDAITALRKHSNRPNPSTLAFIALRLRERGQHERAELIEDLLTREVPESNLRHMVFTFSGNDPSEILVQCDEEGLDVVRDLVGLVLQDHPSFISQVYEESDDLQTR